MVPFQIPIVCKKGENGNSDFWPGAQSPPPFTNPNRSVTQDASLWPSTKEFHRTFGCLHEKCRGEIRRFGRRTQMRVCFVPPPRPHPLLPPPPKKKKTYSVSTRKQTSLEISPVSNYRRVPFNHPPCWPESRLLSLLAIRHRADQVVVPSERRQLNG